MKVLLLFLVSLKLISTKLQNKIVSRDIVNAVMENCMVLESFDKVRRSSLDNIKKEIALICWKTFSHRTCVYTHFLC